MVPAPPFSIQAVPTALSRDAQMFGDVALGHGTVIHPFARVLAIAGPIRFGEYNIIEEGALVENVAAVPDTSASCSSSSSTSTPALQVGSRPPTAATVTATMTFGNHNIIGAKSIIRATTVGHGNRFMPRCEVGWRSVVGDHCTVCAASVVQEGQTLPSGSVVYGFDGRVQRRVPSMHTTEEQLADDDEVVATSRWFRMKTASENLAANRATGGAQGGAPPPPPVAGVAKS